MAILCWFGFIYGVVSPICIIVSTLGILLYYLFQKILCNNRYSIPSYGNQKINYSFINLLDFTPFLIGVF